MITTPAGVTVSDGGSTGRGGSLEIVLLTQADVPPTAQRVRVVECSVSSRDEQADTPCSRQHRLL